jgi:hypothetical protein
VEVDAGATGLGWKRGCSFSFRPVAPGCLDMATVSRFATVGPVVWGNTARMGMIFVFIGIGVSS